MTTQLFIPNKIKVGYQKRKGTYTEKLAYVIYYDAKGKLRKEKSWESWRHKDIEPEEFDNEPHGGFILNKDVQRCNWSNFGSNRSYVRIYDDRGIEFEITPENLLGILTDTDCIKRQLDCEFVYAWQGTELLILPTHTQEYKEAIQYTALQGKNISARDLQPGCSYTTKKQEEYIYLGRYPWCKEMNSYDYYGREGRSCKRIFKKQHLFAYIYKDYGCKNPKWNIEPKSNMNFLAQLNSEEQVKNYAELMDQLKEDVRTSVVTGVEIKKKLFKPVDIKIGTHEKDIPSHRCPETVSDRYFFKKDGDTLEVNEVVCRYKDDRSGNSYRNKIFEGYSIVPYKIFNTKDWSWRYPQGRDRQSHYYRWNRYDQSSLKGYSVLDENETARQVKGMGDALLNLETGKKAKFETLIPI
jgi:hypothetical protein